MVKIVVVVTIKIKQLIDKGYFNDLFFNNFKQFLKRKFKNNFKMMKLHCCHNLLQLQGTICFDSASQRLRPTVPTLFWLSYTDQSNNTQIMRTEK